MFDELLASRGVREVYEPGSAIGVAALHGGLEAGTFEIASQVAATTGASLYAVVQPDDLRWHVPSTRFDPNVSPALRRFVDSVQFVVSLHGFGRRHLTRTALLGGRNHAAADGLARALAAQGFTAVSDPAAIPAPLRGRHERNPVNLPPAGGVQIELTPDLRRRPDRDRFAAALAGALPPLAAAHAGI